MFEIRAINNAISLALLDLEGFAKSQNLQSKREIEKAGTLFLLKKLMNDENVELTYSETNKPFLKHRSEHISISHSHAKLAIIVNRQEPTGIDIELIRDKVKSIQNKFLNENEIDFANNNVETLVTLWAAKETLYKIYGRKKMEFKQHLFVEPFHSSSIIGKIEINGFRKRYELVKEKIDEYILVYMIKGLTA
ncbi:MAG: 4'-phosphopantetheinyl transferase superfamily protein [Bacteroidetes bacterium]|nr:4'-phosphopantetheinyl transferase superfamily protein [Bacteroidota bacterium]